MPEAHGTIGPVGGVLTATFTLDDGKVVVYTTNVTSPVVSKPNEAKLTYVTESDLTGEIRYSGTIGNERVRFALGRAQPGTSFEAAVTGGPSGSALAVTGNGHWGVI